jgi:MFS family permease
MHALLLPLTTLLSGVALLVVGVGLLFSVLGLRAGLAEFSTVVTGLVMSAYFAGFVLGTRLCPLLIRRVGHVRAFAALASLASTMPILHALWIEPAYWALLRLVTGVCLVGLYIVVESWLNALAPPAQRGKVFALYLTVSCVAMALGQWLLLVGDRLGFVPFATVSVLLSFALLPLTLTPVAEPEPMEAPSLGLRALYRISPLGVAGALGSGALTGALFGLGAVFVQRLGHGDAMVAGFMAATILGGALFQWPIGQWSDRSDRRVVLFATCAGVALLAGGGFVLVRMLPAALVPLGVLLGGLMFAVYGLSVAHVNDLIDASRLLEVTGGLLLLHGIGAALGPTLAGGLMGALGPGSLLLYFAAVGALLALYTLQRMRFAPPVPPEAKSGFVPMGEVSPAALRMDPRAPQQDPR